MIREEVTWLNSQLNVDESKQNSAFRKMVAKFKDSSGRHYQLEAKLRLLDACSTRDYQTPWKQARKRGVATWFTTAPEYQQWKQQSVSGTLLCTGKLGSGKTTLMASMVDDLVSTCGKGNLVYFFCRYDITESLTARAMFGSLTRQLLCQQTVELARLQQDYASQVTLDCDKMLEILQTLLSHNEKYYILVDGLDECPQSEIETIIELLQNLQRVLSTLICISYREEARSPVEKLSKEFAQIQTLKAPEINPDIEAYIDAELQGRLQSDELTIGDPTVVLSIQEALLKGAQGMFLWVALLIDCVCTEQTDEAILRVLHDLPHSLSEVFSRVLKNSTSGNSKYLRQIVQMIMAARRPLTIYEFREVLSVIPGDTDWKPARLINNIRATLGCCGSLIIIDEEELTVRFAHHSIKHFFTKSQEIGPTSTQEADEKMGAIILTYLNYGVFDNQVSRIVAPNIPASETASAVINSALRESSGSTRRIASSLIRSKKQITHDVGKMLTEVAFSTWYRSLEAFHFMNYVREYYHYHISVRLIRNKAMEKLWHRFLARDNLDLRLAPWLQYNLQQSRLKVLNGFLIPFSTVDTLVSFQVLEKVLRESGNKHNEARWIYGHGRRWFATLVYSQMTEFIPLLLSLKMRDDSPYGPNADNLVRVLSQRVSPLSDLVKRFDAAKFFDVYRELSAPIITQGIHIHGGKEVVPIVVTRVVALEIAGVSYQTAVIPRANHPCQDTLNYVNENGDLCAVVVKKARKTSYTYVRPVDNLAFYRYIYASLATFQLGDDVFEIWPLPPPHGSLKDLWILLYANRHNEGVKRWSICQMVGIAEALDFIHNGRIAEVFFHGDIRPEHIQWRGGMQGVPPPNGILQLKLPHRMAPFSVSDNLIAKQRDITMLCCIYLVIAACLVPLEWKDILALHIDLQEDLDLISGKSVSPKQERLGRWVSKLNEESAHCLILHRVISFISTGFLACKLPFSSQNLVSGLRQAAHEYFQTG
ncbi:predicted protein [Aspergillus terreus NIH2624]|uniref:NACHT domain-containing protein n=1 Tax=Aspergillus terreus (strain NIH 2624 / FGSC A1156) TaxID=341663 RepID=Q0CAJ0_ASPTN|nr:uncharacterized protein ATEG_09294 [Aspergillus terreus NIH2624]EAU30431.1 predicted protein [Aspergillus terreus NIH2624]